MPLHCRAVLWFYADFGFALRRHACAHCPRHHSSSTITPIWHGVRGCMQPNTRYSHRGRLLRSGRHAKPRQVLALVSSRSLLELRGPELAASANFYLYTCLQFYVHFARLCLVPWYADASLSRHTCPCSISRSIVLYSAAFPMPFSFAVLTVLAINCSAAKR